MTKVLWFNRSYIRLDIKLKVDRNQSSEQLQLCSAVKGHYVIDFRDTAICVYDIGCRLQAKINATHWR